MGVVVDDDEVSPICKQAIDQPVSTAAIDLAAGVAVADRALQLEAIEQSFAAPILGVGRPDEAFDGHRRRSYAALGTVLSAGRIGGLDLAL
jgi:hypothetical protein